MKLVGFGQLRATPTSAAALGGVVSNTRRSLLAGGDEPPNAPTCARLRQQRAHPLEALALGMGTGRQRRRSPGLTFAGAIRVGELTVPLVHLQEAGWPLRNVHVGARGRAQADAAAATEQQRQQPPHGLHLIAVQLELSPAAPQRACPRRCPCVAADLGIASTKTTICGCRRAAPPGEPAAPACALSPGGPLLRLAELESGCLDTLPECSIFASGARHLVHRGRLAVGIASAIGSIRTRRVPGKRSPGRGARLLRMPSRRPQHHRERHEPHTIPEQHVPAISVDAPP